MAGVESFQKTPMFSDLLRGIYEYLQTSYHDVFLETRHLNKLDSCNITIYDITCITVFTALLAVLRSVLTKRVFMPIANYYDISEASRKKVPETAWFFTFYLFTWNYEWYVVVLNGKYKFFQEPETIWHGWSLKAFPPGDIYFIYVIQTAFYLHATYAALFLDKWRKDSGLVVFHHVLVLLLLILSHANRCHNIGVLLAFVYDLSQIFSEFTCLCSYFKIQCHNIQKWIQMMEKVGFACFVATWFISRLYWYPMKVIYSVVVHLQRLQLDIPYHVLMSLTMGVLNTTHIYWSVLILKNIYRIALEQKRKKSL